MTVSSVGGVSNAYDNKMSPVTKGALIGAGADALLAGSLLVHGAKTYSSASGDTFINSAKKVLNTTSDFVGGKGKYALITVAEMALCALIGAGIGKLVKNHQEKVANKEAEKSIDTNT